MDTEIENAAYKFAESQNDGSNFTAYYKGFIAGTKYKKSSNGVSLSMNIIMQGYRFQPYKIVDWLSRKLLG